MTHEIRATAIARLCLAGAALALTALPVQAQDSAPKINLPPVKHPIPLETNAQGIYGLEHTHVITGNIEKSVRFYVDLLGFYQVTQITETAESPAMVEMLGLPKEARFKQVILGMPGGASYGSHVPGIEIWEITGIPLDTTLSDNPTMNLQGKGYNAYRVKDLGVLIERLREAGVKFVSKQVFLTPEISGIYALDPDGQIVELDQFPKPLGEE